MATNKNSPSVSGISSNSDNNTISNSGQSSVGTEGGKNLRSLNPKNSVRSQEDHHDDPIIQFIRCNECRREFDEIDSFKFPNLRLHSKRMPARGIAGKFKHRDNLQSMIISIGKLHAKDANSVRNVMMSEYPEDECNSENEIAKILDYSNKFAINLSFAAWHNDQMVAFLLTQIKSTDRDSPYIHTIVVRNEYRGKRLGKKLIELMIEKCKKNQTAFGFVNIQLHCEVTNQRAISIYEQFGFTLVERMNSDYGTERHGQLMSKILEN